MPASLIGAGMEPGDYELIQQGRQRVDEVNERLRKRGSPLQYAVVLLTITPAGEPLDRRQQILEGG